MTHSNKQLNDLNIITNISFTKLDSKYKEKTFKNLLLDTATSFIVNTPTEDLERIANSNPKHTIDNLSMEHKKPFMNLFGFNRNIFTNVIGEVWNDAFETGIKHHIADLLYNNKSFKKVFNEKVSKTKPKNIKFGYIGITDIAEFISQRERDKRNKASKDKARVTRNIRLLDEAKRLRLFERLGLDGHEFITGRMNMEQRKSFLESIKTIVNDSKKAEAMKANYLGSNYIKQRKAVLGIEYARRYDQYVKQDIKDYLSKDIGSVKSIKSSAKNINDITTSIRASLTSLTVDETLEERTIRARRIVRTELVLAYNFGKLAAFNSPEDLDRIVEWNADFELEGLITGYEVCKACKFMNGKRYTVRHLLEIGSITDTGVLNYKGTEETKTVWKNPNFPVIAYHPNCNCRWVSIDNGTKKVTKSGVEKGTTTRASSNKSELRISRSNKDIDRNIEDIQKANEQSDSIEKAIDTAINVTGLGLAVTGGFLLARSNAFKSFIKEIDKTGEEVINSVSKVKNLVKDEDISISNKVVDNLSNIYKPATEEYRTVRTVEGIENIDNEINNELPGYEIKPYRYAVDYIEDKPIEIKRERSIRQTLDDIQNKAREGIIESKIEGKSKLDNKETITKDEKVYKLENGNIITKDDITNLEKIIDVLEEGQKEVSKLPDREYLDTYNELVIELGN